MEELDLSWCTSLESVTLVTLLPAATRLRSLGLRGVSLEGVLEAALETLARTQSLEAIDVAFCSGLQSQAVMQLAVSCPLLKRCNLRAATGIDALTYNEVGRLMLERAPAVEKPERRGEAVEEGFHIA